MCCFHRVGNIGNLIDKTFDEIWFGEIAESIRQETQEGRLHSLCQCPGCPFVSMKEYPLHNIIYNEYPTELEIDLPNTHCNVGGFKPSKERPACIMCERSDPNFVAEVDLLDVVLKKIKHVVPNLAHLHIQGIAEPFWHDQIYHVLNELEFEKYKNQIQVTTTTNGILLKKENREKWFEVPKSVTVFSIDAATEPTFYKVRGQMKVFELVVKHLHEFNIERDRRNHRLKIHNNINLMNVHEVRGMVRMAKSAGVDVLEFNPTSGFFIEILVNQHNAQIFRRAHLEIVEEATKLGQKVEFIRPLDLGFVGGTPMELDWRPNPELNRLVQIDLSNLAGIPKN